MQDEPILPNPPDDVDAPRLTPLDALHRELGGRMVTFAGYLLPVQYPAGVLTEHRQARNAAALFDVSHMGQALMRGPDVAVALERLVPGDIAGLRPGRQRYTLLTNEAGGIIDDLMVARLDDQTWFLVLNASRKADDMRHIADRVPESIRPVLDDARALLALQGPQAAAALTRLWPGADAMKFLDVAVQADIAGVPAIVARSGYTGEDGFEISVAADRAETVARALLAQPEVALAGLGARDSLRLEAGLCLYGQDIDELTTPIEAGLGWVIGKRRRMAWDFLGGVAIRDQAENGPARSRVGMRLDGAAPARAGASIVALDGTEAGTVTSGCPSPTLGAPIAMGYVRHDLAADGTELAIMVRGRALPARVVPLPFVPSHVHR
jgi:aminomethyltransferase